MMSNFSFSSTEVLIGVALVVLAIMGIIVYARRYFYTKSNEDLTTKYSGKKWDSPLTARNKYPDVDVFQWQPIFLRLGVVVALALIFGAFNITSRSLNASSGDFQLSIDEDVEIEIPRSQEAPPPPPPPPPPTVQEVAMVDILDEKDEMNFVDQSVDASTEVQAPPPVTRERTVAPPPPPPPPPPRDDHAREIFVVVEEMPRFPGCEDIAGDTKAKKACADKKLMEFIYANIQYPAIARENGVEGNVVLQFVVNTDGTVTETKVMRDIGAGCGEEAIRVVALMNNMKDRWIPGKQRGRPVRVMFTLPIKFKLQYN